MEITPLRQLLQSLCCNSDWNYAVFWKLQDQGEMLLTWEDGCCSPPMRDPPMESIIDEILSNGSNDMLALNWKSGRNGGWFDGCSIGPVVADMENVQYRWGEGIVGEAAFSGKHCWFSQCNVSAGAFESKYPDEWLPQLAAGIKTILLIPVAPYGVLQLGSLAQVMEDLVMVADIRYQVYTSCFCVGNFLPLFSERELLAPSISSSGPVLMQDLVDPSDILMSTMKAEAAKVSESANSTNSRPLTASQMVPLGLVQDSFHVSGNHLLENFDIIMEHENNVHQMDSIEDPGLPNQSLYNYMVSEMIEGSLVGFPCLEDDLQVLCLSNNHDVDGIGHGFYKNMASYADGVMIKPPLIDRKADGACEEDTQPHFSFPRHCELHKALGPGFPEHTKEYLLDSFFSEENPCSSSIPIPNRSIIHGAISSAGEPCGWSSKSNLADHLVESIVANGDGSLNNNLSNRFSHVKSSVTSLGHSKMRSQSGEGAFAEERSSLSALTPAYGIRDCSAINSPNSVSSFESMIGAFTLGKQQKKYNHQHMRKGSKLSTFSKRRAKPCENPRPRPRDRQLIQDRVKKLRELVPNGAKCSIDGLLDQTVKHMLHLKSVTAQADKLKQWVEHEKTLKSSGGSEKHQNGISWGFELGSNFPASSIVVEDLGSHGHLLIEMLCSDYELFLEIAEVIRGMELTILKGEMENRLDNMWAYFIVEVSDGFQRLDIFWPLMQLVQQNWHASSKI